jgi:putative exporter of polyketide antibiotics
MSTPISEPTSAAAESPTTQTFQPADATTTTESTSTSTSAGTLGNVEPIESDATPGFITRHTTTLITLMVAVIVAAVAIAGVVLWRNHLDEANADTEAAFAKTVAGQGASLETVECSGDTCAAVINGQAYTVLVQEDGKGNQHFGVTNYVGD